MTNPKKSDMKKTNQTLLKGNEATVYGALLAGCDCYFGYPITPASEIAHTAAQLFPKLGRVFLQAESEIAAINMVLGAASAGKRVMTASSGLGISLKQEGVSYMATCELPAVIVDIMRGGPGLGNIGPEQSDYNQVVKGGGHGNYKCIVLAPNSCQEMCDLTIKGFDLAFKYRTPVYVLADGVIGQMLEGVTLPEPIKGTPPSWALVSGPGTRNNHLTSIYLKHDDLEQVNIMLQNKYREIEKCEQDAETYEVDDAELIIISYGICSRVVHSSIMEMREDGLKVGMIRPLTLFPFPKDVIRKVVKPETEVLCVEMSNGQMIDDVRLTLECKNPIHLFNRMGGNVPTVNEVKQKCRELLKKS